MRKISGSNVEWPWALRRVGTTDGSVPEVSAVLFRPGQVFLYLRGFRNVFRMV